VTRTEAILAAANRCRSSLVGGRGRAYERALVALDAAVLLPDDWQGAKPPAARRSEDVLRLVSQAAETVA